MKRLMMIAGPNGAGKTTTANAFLSVQNHCYSEFLNADQIALGLSPLQPESVNRQAGELMVKRFHDSVKLGINFVFETTASGISYATHLKKAQENGYELNLIYLWLSSSDQAVKRVAERVRQGGHNIPEEDIRRRYDRGIKNLVNLYLPLANTALILDNSSVKTGIMKIIAMKGNDGQLKVEDEEIWQVILECTNVRV